MSDAFNIVRVPVDIKTLAGQGPMAKEALKKEFIAALKDFLRRTGADPSWIKIQTEDGTIIPLEELMNHVKAL